MERDLGLTFAGGGNRAFYQLGLLRRWSGELWGRVAGVAACSAGACVALMHLSGRAEEGHAFWLRRRDGVTRNFQWERLLRGERPTPHFPIYRDTLLHTFAEGGLERVRAQPFPILVLAARPPRRLPGTLAVLLGSAVYTLEKQLRPGMVHPTWGRALGFAPVAADARDCASAADLAELVLASSATPPFTPVGAWRGERLLDGGLVDNVPAFLTDALPGVRRNLVFLTRPYPTGALGERAGRLYLAPTRPVPIERWDYTRPEALAATIRMGEEEATVHAPALRRFLS